MTNNFWGDRAVNSWESGRPSMAYPSPPNCDGLYAPKNPYQDKADQAGVPLIPPLPDRPLDPNPVVAICGACGREVRQVEMYSCSRTNCPIQPRVFC